MPKLCNLISRGSHCRGLLTVRSSAGNSLFFIGMACLWSQEANDMARESLKCLKIAKWITTFLCFFQVLFSLVRLQNLLIFVCKCSLYTEEWIRFTKVHSIFSHYWFWSWFDSLENPAKNRLKPIFLCTQRPCTNSIKIGRASCRERV